MTEEKYKPDAKCRFYFSCPIYNSGILRPNFESEMCGTGQLKDEKYIPKIPDHEKITPVKGWELWPGESICPAFENVILGEFRHYVNALSNDIDRVLKGIEPIYKMK